MEQVLIFFAAAPDPAQTKELNWKLYIVDKKLE